MKDELLEIEIDLISVNPFQPRRHFAREELQELAASISAVGIIHPPTVRPLGKSRGYELISGERRLRAAQLAKLTKIPVIIRHSSSSDSAHAALIENIQRVDLNPIEIARALHNLAEEFDLGQEELAQRLGKKRSTVANYLRMLHLPEVIQNSVSEGMISMGHAKALLSLDLLEHQILLHNRIVRDGLSVRETEAAAKSISLQKGIKHPLPASRNIHLDHLTNQLQEKLGTRVFIRGKGSQGRIHIDYYTLDDLDRILSFLKVEEDSF